MWKQAGWRDRIGVVARSPLASIHSSLRSLLAARIHSSTSFVRNVRTRRSRKPATLYSWRTDGRTDPSATPPQNANRCSQQQYPCPSDHAAIWFPRDLSIANSRSVRYYTRSAVMEIAYKSRRANGLVSSDRACLKMHEKFPMVRRNQPVPSHYAYG